MKGEREVHKGTSTVVPTAPHHPASGVTCVCAPGLLFYGHSKGRALITYKGHIQPGLTAGHHVFPYIPPEKDIPTSLTHLFQYHSFHN